MKKIYLLLLFIYFGFSIQAQIVNIPNVNFKNALLQASPTNSIASIDTPNPDGSGIIDYHTIDTNNDDQIQVSEASAIKFLDVSLLGISDLQGIQSFTNLQYLACHQNDLINLNLSGLSNLIGMKCFLNQLTSLNISGLTNLQHLDCAANYLTNIDVSGTINLRILACYDNQLTSLNVSGLINLRYLSCHGNQLTTLNLNGLTELRYLYCYINQLTTIDVTSSPNLLRLVCPNNQLITLFIKNNNETWEDLQFGNNPNIQYICVDDEDLTLVQQKVNQYGYTSTCQINSYCSFNPGGTFYTIQGNNKYDGNTNGCDALDMSIPFMKYNFTNGSISGNLITNNTGNYSIPVEAGTHTITPQFENPTYFSVSPTNAIISFPTQTSPFTQNFCITPNGVHHDLEIVIVPIYGAVPGFDARYKIICKNKGNQTENATVIFNYNDALLDYVSATIVPNSQSTGTATWNFGTLVPLQRVEIIVTLNVNSPTETPAVNAGDIMSFSASVIGMFPDVTIVDNTFSLNQMVENSFDPNDKICLQGATITPDKVGEYVHYRIRFENMGTANAQNIVVKDIIDTTKFNLNTLQITDTSHSCVTRVTNPNKVEFVFQGINLPFDDANNDGYLVFKIKTKSTLVTGSSFSNTASIYFDYNFPIITNTATTTIQALVNQDFEFSNYFKLAPNPAKNVLQIQSKKDIELSTISIYNTLGQVILIVPNAKETSTIDVSQLTSGTYFVKVISDRGTSNTKFIKA